MKNNFSCRTEQRHSFSSVHLVIAYRNDPTRGRSRSPFRENGRKWQTFLASVSYPLLPCFGFFFFVLFRKMYLQSAAIEIFQMRRFPTSLSEIISVHDFSTNLCELEKRENQSQWYDPRLHRTKDEKIRDWESGTRTGGNVRSRISLVTNFTQAFSLPRFSPSPSRTRTRECIRFRLRNNVQLIITLGGRSVRGNEEVFFFQNSVFLSTR